MYVKMIKEKLLLLAAFVVLAIPLIFADSAEATTVCTDCHDGTTAPDKSLFAQTGHANYLRKVTPGVELLGPNGEHYATVRSATTYAPGTPDWTAGTLGGLPMYYLLDGWLGFKGAPYAVTTKYSCGACHTTGYQANCSDASKASKSACVAAGATWTPDPLKAPTTDGVPSSVIDNISGSWTKAGVQCERCHGGLGDDITAHDATHTPTEPTGVAVNALCSECHAAGDYNGYLNSPHSRFTGTTTEPVLFPGYVKWAGLDNAANYESHFVQYYGGGCTTCHDVHKSMAVTSHETATWTGHGGEAHYCSDSTVSKNAGQAACEAAGGTWLTQTGFVRACISCHNGAYNRASINHPTGAGTPLAEGTAGACVVCHMEGSGNHLFRINTSASYTYKLDMTGTCSVATKKARKTCQDAGGTWTPNSVADDATCYAQGGYGGEERGVAFCSDATMARMGRMAAEGDFAEAQWVDIDQACGQCHGGGASEATMPGELVPGAPYKTKAILGAIAKSMHSAGNAAPVAKVNSVTVSGANGMTVTVVDSSTDADGTTNKVKIVWGDGTISEGANGGTFVHTYNRAKTYTVAHSVYDGLQGDSDIFTVTVPKTIKISGNVTIPNDNAGGVTLILKYNGHTKKRIKTSATPSATSAFEFTDVRPITNGKYSISAYKYHVKFGDTSVVWTSTDSVIDPVISVPTFTGTKW